MLIRRRFFALSVASFPLFSHAAPKRFAALPVALKQLEKDNGGRLGVSVVDLGTGERAGHRADERFPMCSTFKFLLAAAVLQRVDAHHEMLDRTLAIPQKPLLSHSPLSEPHAGQTMTVEELCHAVVVQSDNTAANLLLDIVGGPPGITRFARSIGDPVTRLDRTELALNEALVGDLRDTTSPTAMVGNLKALVLGTTLSLASRDLLTQWMVGCETGLDRLRARLPAGWGAADKTGANGEHTTNDIAVFWPPGRAAPLLIAAYITQCHGPETKRANLLARIGQLVTAWT